MDMVKRDFRVLEPGMVGFSELELLEKSHTKRYLIDYLKLTLRPMGEELDQVVLDECVASMLEGLLVILSRFGIDVAEIDYQLHGSNSKGYNRTYKLTDTVNDLKIFVRYYEADEQADKLYRFKQQGLQIDMSGNSCAYIRNKGRMLEFLTMLADHYHVSGSRIDVTLDDMIGRDCPVGREYAGSVTKRYVKLYEKGKYSGRCGMNAIGAIENPAIYLGKMRSHKSLLIYDKLQEAMDKKVSDEPELMNVLKSMTRYEIVIKNDKQDCTRVLEELLTAKSEAELFKIVGQIHTRIMTEKCRFLKKPKEQYSHGRYHQNDPIWDFVTDNERSTIVFASHVPKNLTLAQRAENFQKRNIGGLKFCKEFIDVYGRSAFDELLLEMKG